MPSVFSDDTLWQHATFTFSVVDSASQVEITKRGQPKTAEKKISVTFKMRPQNRVPQSKQTGAEVISELTENYECRVVAVNGNYEALYFPPEIKPEDVGAGNFRNRKCRATVKGIAQSSLSPILEDILGAKVTLALDYSAHRGVKK